MISLDRYLDELLSRGRAYFSREDALEAFELNPAAFVAAAGRLAKKKKLVSPRRGFYQILRPEDRVVGAPDPVRWIDPLRNIYISTIAFPCCVLQLFTAPHTQRQWSFR